MIFLVGTIEGATPEQRENWIPEIYNSATSSWKLTAQHPLDYGYNGKLIERVESTYSRVIRRFLERYYQ